MTKSAKLMLGAAALAGVLMACGGADEPTAAAAATTAAPATTQAPATTAVPTTAAPTTTTRPPKVWSPDDFAVELTVLEESCYGSAGGLVTLEPDLVKVGSGEVENELTIIYEVRGGEYGAETYNFDVTPPDSYSWEELDMSTANCGDKITAEVVQVIDRG